MKPIVIIYDDKCSLCRGYMNWIKLHAIKRGVFEFISCQSEERIRRYPDITQDACLDALHLVTPDDRILIGEKSLPEILSRLKYFRWMSSFFKMFIINYFFYVAYRVIANNRYIISRTILPLTQEKV